MVLDLARRMLVKYVPDVWFWCGVSMGLFDMYGDLVLF